MAHDEIFVGIKNWDQFQHYKDGRPVQWIKLHVAVRSDYRFARLPDATKAHLLMLWTLAPELGNRIPLDPDYLAREIHADGPIDLERLLRAGFLVPLDGATLDDAYEIVRNRTDPYGGPDPASPENRPRKSLEYNDVRIRTKSYESVRPSARALAESREYEEEGYGEEEDAASLRSAGAGAPEEKSAGTNGSAPDLAALAPTWMPLIRRHLRPEGSHLVAGWTDERDLSLVAELLGRGRPAEEIERALAGFAHLRDMGELAGADIHPDTAVTMRIFVRQTGPDSIYAQSLHHARKFGVPA